MKRTFAFAAFALVSAGAWSADSKAASKLPPLKNPALLNIGFVCKWQDACIRKQLRAMGRALGYVRKYRPPAWKIQLCNRNAGRNGTRVDWIGFNNCVRNPALRPPPALRPQPARPRARRR